MTTLSPDQALIYRIHGAKGLSARALQREAGCSFHAAKKVTEYAAQRRQEPDLNILVIGDAHVKPGQDLRRFDALGAYIDSERPDVVLCIGDFADMESLSCYDKGKKSFEGRRLTQDFDAAQEAMDRLFAAVSSETKADTRWVLTMGNHEHRIARAANDSPALAGFLTDGELGYSRHWEVHDFLAPVEIAGVTFAHYFVSGVMGRPIGGKALGFALVQQTYSSVVQGHTHLYDHYCSATTPDGRRRHGLSVGCFFEHDEDFAGPANRMYWRGVVMLRGVKDGDYDLETVSMARLLKNYGG